MMKASFGIPEVTLGDAKAGPANWIAMFQLNPAFGQ
jgi:hypothetical protein